MNLHKHITDDLTHLSLPAKYTDRYLCGALPKSLKYLEIGGVSKKIYKKYIRD